MPEKIEKDGVEIDVFTAEEVAAREAAAVDAIKAEHATALAAKEAELKKVSDDLSKLGEKDHNFSVLRSQKEELEKQIKESGEKAEAYLLATGSTVKSDPLNRALPTGGGRMPNINSTPLTPEQVELGKKMGVTEEDIKKHGGKK